MIGIDMKDYASYFIGDLSKVLSSIEYKKIKKYLESQNDSSDFDNKFYFDKTRYAYAFNVHESYFKVFDQIGNEYSCTDPIIGCIRKDFITKKITEKTLEHGVFHELFEPLDVKFSHRKAHFGPVQIEIFPEKKLEQFHTDQETSV